MGAFTAYPYSRGSIHITGRDPFSQPDFDAGFLSRPVDVQGHIWAYKRNREIARRLSFYRGELSLGHPSFPKGSKAAVEPVPGDECPDHRELNGSGGTGLPNIEYSKADDAAIEQWIRENVNTTWHSLGTCAMRSREDGGVLDRNLDVYGVKGLKVAGMSFFTSLPDLKRILDPFLRAYRYIHCAGECGSKHQFHCTSHRRKGGRDCLQRAGAGRFRKYISFESLLVEHFIQKFGNCRPCSVSIVCQNTCLS